MLLFPGWIQRYEKERNNLIPPRNQIQRKKEVIHVYACKTDNCAPSFYGRGTECKLRWKEKMIYA